MVSRAITVYNLFTKTPVSRKTQHKIYKFDICQNKNLLFLLGTEFFLSVFFRTVEKVFTD